MLCLCEAMHICLMDAFLPRFVITAKEERPGFVAGGCPCVPSAAARRKVPPSGLKDRCQAGRVRMFIALWLTGARRNYFRSRIWLTIDLFRRELLARRASGRAAMSCHKTLKSNQSFSLINRPLN